MGGSRAWWCVVLAGCVSAAPTVEEGCEEELVGAELLGDVPETLFFRVNCYRGFLGLRPLTIEDQMQESAEAHMAYMVTHDVLNPESPTRARNREALLGETPDTEGFTGVNPFQRAVATGAVARSGGVASGSVWGWFLHDSNMAPATVIANPFVRDALFHPNVIGVGHAQGFMLDERRGYFDLHAAVPTGVRAAKPVVYPKHKQTGVPTGWRDPYAFTGEPFSGDEPVGFPVTVTFTSDRTGDEEDNPYEVKLVLASLSEVDGAEVPVLTSVPRFGRQVVMRSTIAVAAAEPLKANTEYAFHLEAETTFGPYTIDSTFTTGDARVVE